MEACGLWYISNGDGYASGAPYIINNGQISQDGNNDRYFTTTVTETNPDIILNGTVSAKNNQIKNVADPTDSQDAATKNYVDNAGIQGPAGPAGRGDGDVRARAVDQGEGVRERAHGGGDEQTERAREAIQGTSRPGPDPHGHERALRAFETDRAPAARGNAGVCGEARGKAPARLPSLLSWDRALALCMCPVD